MKVYSYDWLCEKMRDRSKVVLHLSTSAGSIMLQGMINGIRPEDGSGRNWLVTVNDNLTNSEVYIRTA